MIVPNEEFFDPPKDVFSPRERAIMMVMDQMEKAETMPDNGLTLKEKVEVAARWINNIAHTLEQEDK